MFRPEVACQLTNLAVNRILPGYKFCHETKSLIFCQNQLKADENISPELKTLQVLQEIANSLLTMLNWEIHIHQNRGGLTAPDNFIF